MKNPASLGSLFYFLAYFKVTVIGKMKKNSKTLKCFKKLKKLGKKKTEKLHMIITKKKKKKVLKGRNPTRK